jgi:SAM-dependent methyltransferase
LSAPLIFDRKLLSQRRRRAALAGKPPDFLLRRAGEDMAERLTGIQRQFSRALIVGADARALAALLTPVIGADLTVVMEPDLDRSADVTPPYSLVIADEEALPFGEAAFDLVATALSLHLVNDLPGTLVQIRRALKPDGLLLASVLGGATLAELREAFTQAEAELEGGVSPRVAPMADIRDYGGLLQRAGFALPVADADLVTATYATPFALMQDLRAMGASNMLAARRKTPLRRATLARAAEIYAQRFPAPGNRIRATFEIIHLSGWSPDESQQKPLKPGSAKARLADALGVPETPFKLK